MIFSKERDPRLITIRRGGLLTDEDHHLLALWAATCAEHVLHLFEGEQPGDPRPRQAIKAVRAAVPPHEAVRAGRRECRWQREQLPDPIRELVLDDQRRRNHLCWGVFEP